MAGKKTRPGFGERLVVTVSETYNLQPLHVLHVFLFSSATDSLLLLKTGLRCRTALLPFPRQHGLISGNI